MELTRVEVKQIVREQLDDFFQLVECPVCKGDTRMIKTYVVPPDEIHLAKDYLRCLVCSNLFEQNLTKANP